MGKPSVAVSAPQPREDRLPPAGASAGPAPAMLGAPVQLVAWLQELVASGGSDLHVKVGSPPMVREVGRLRRLERPPVGAKELSELARAIVPPNRRARFED